MICMLVLPPKLQPINSLVLIDIGLKETTSTGSGVNLVEGTSNGSDYITLKSPDSLAGIVTYTLPGTQGTVKFCSYQ
jgi:hypothetical protein